MLQWGKRDCVYWDFLVYNSAKCRMKQHQLNLNCGTTNCYSNRTFIWDTPILRIMVSNLLKHYSIWTKKKRGDFTWKMLTLKLQSLSPWAQEISKVKSVSMVTFHCLVSEKKREIVDKSKAFSLQHIY